MGKEGFSANSHLNLEPLNVYYHQILSKLKNKDIFHLITDHHGISFSLRKLKGICRRKKHLGFYAYIG